MRFEARCTAVLLPGVITQRVDRVIRPTKEAKALIAAAQAEIDAIENPGPLECARNFRLRMRRRLQEARKTYGDPVPPTRRRRSGSARPVRPARKFKIIGVSVYDEDLAAMDAAVVRLKEAGHRTMWRSRLLRVAFSKLDVDALISELRTE